MAKSQDQCFRVWGGARWPNMMDMHTSAEEAEVSHWKNIGIRVRIRAHRRGFRQAFVHPDDVQSASAAWIDTPPNTISPALSGGADAKAD